MKILIDNGHGRETPGKRSPDGKLRVYAYNRLISCRIVQHLQALGFDAQLLVPEQEDIPLPERCRRVNVHCRHRANTTSSSFRFTSTQQVTATVGWTLPVGVHSPHAATPRPMPSPPAFTKLRHTISQASTSVPTTPMEILTSSPPSHRLSCRPYGELLYGRPPRLPLPPHRRRPTIAC